MIWFLLHVASTWFLVGLTWVVQIVHYPLFNRVGTAYFVDYEAAHMKAISFVVIPAMFLELGTAIWLCASPVVPMPSPFAWINLGLLLLIWVSTFVIQVPQHRRLVRGFDEQTYRGLIRGNWLRTALWSARGILLLCLQAV